MAAIELAGEAVVGLVRATLWVVSELVVEIAIRGLGGLVCRARGTQQPSEAEMLGVGIVAWSVLLALLVVGWRWLG